MARVVVAFQIPLREDEEIGQGSLHPPFRWKALMDTLYVSFDGWTEVGEWPGVWKSEKTGAAVHDVSRAFQVDVDEARLDEIRALLRRACKTFVQQSLRVIIRGESEYLEGGPDDEPL